MNTEITTGDLDHDVAIHEVEGEDYVVLDKAEETTELYRVKSSTTNARALWTAEAVLYQGAVLYPAIDDIGRIILVHNWSGKREAFLPREWLDNKAWKLESVPTK